MRAQIQNRLVTEAPFRSFSFQDQTTGMHSVSALPVGTPCQQCTARPPEDRRRTLTSGLPGATFNSAVENSAVAVASPGYQLSGSGSWHP